MPQESQVFTEAGLTSAVAAIFAAHDVPQADARRVAECLVLADLRGVSSHGVSRVPIYLDRLRRGLVKARPCMVLDRPVSVAARLDADDALGFVAATRAMAEAVHMARDHGMGMCAVRRSTHFGMAASYLLQATDAGMAAFVFTNASRAILDLIEAGDHAGAALQMEAHLNKVRHSLSALGFIPAQDVAGTTPG